MIKLVDNWKHGWKWLSNWFSTASVVMNTVGAITLKGAAASTAVLGLVPMRYALMIGALVSALAVAGRLVCQKKQPKRDASEQDAEAPLGIG